MMKGRDILKGLTEAQNPARAKTRPPTTQPSGSVKALQTELDKIADEAASAKELKEAIAREGQIIKLDPNLVDGASITDRIPVQDDDQFDVLKAAIQEAGQQVPILVRPSSAGGGRYEAAYGHRRLRATKELGIAVRAIVRELSDPEMVLAQGQENGPRQDLSFIERALYAAKLLEHGYDKDLVCNAVGVDKPELSRLKTVAENIDHEVIMAIGPARKIGRPRWSALAKALDNMTFAAKLKNMIGEEEFKSTADSNTRFELLLQLSSKPRKPKPSEPKIALNSTSEAKLGWVQKTRRGATFAIENQQLSEFLQGKMPELLIEFEQQSQSKK